MALGTVFFQYLGGSFAIVPLILPTNLHLLTSRSIRTQGEAREPKKEMLFRKSGAYNVISIQKGNAFSYFIYRI